MDQTERRRFSRVPFAHTVVLQQGDQRWSAQLVDISLKGVLVALENGSGQPDGDAPLSATIALSDQDQIQMQLKLVRTESETWALVCESIDVDSISHLRRLVELNLGNPQACERELNELLQPAP